MADTKGFASLSSGLLARKGAARPAMRRQGLGSMVAPVMAQDDLGWNDMGYDVDPPKDAEPHAGERPHHGPLLAGAIPAGPAGGEASVSPVALPEVVRQRDELARRLADEPASAVEPEAEALAVQEEPDHEPVVAKPAARPALRSLPGGAATGAPKASRPITKGKSDGRKAAFTLRIDPDRHLRLRLACAVHGRSAQQLVMEALDSFLDAQPQVDQLARSVKGG